MSCFRPACLLVSITIGAACAAEPKALTQDGRECYDPVYLAEGKEVVYTMLETPTLTSLMKLRLEDGKIERLHPQATTSEFEATFAKDGQTYAFVQCRANLNLKLVIRDVKQNREALYDPGGGFAGLRRPSITPHGSRVFFALPSATGPQIVVCNAQGGDRKTIASAGFNNWPAVSPDGKRLAFGSSKHGDFDLYVTDLDGSNELRLTKNRSWDARPTWSPDGKQLAFTSSRDGNYEIYLVGSDGANLRRVTQHPERDDYPSWHPDGRSLIFVGERKGRFDLYTMPVP